MENIISLSSEENSRPEVTRPPLRILDEVVGEIQETIQNTHWVETRLADLKTRGFQIEHCWVKNGRISTVWYMKRKKEFRIQVADSELCGKYYKAYCVVIPESNILLKSCDRSRVRGWSGAVEAVSKENASNIW